jgi:hypothetical protein
MARDQKRIGGITPEAKDTGTKDVANKLALMGSGPGRSAGGLLWMAAKWLPMERPTSGSTKAVVTVANTSLPGKAST